MTTLVWFRRDLRTEDHGPLVEAARRGEQVIPLYIVEPEYWRLPDSSRRQWDFIAESLADLDRQLRRLGSTLVVRHGEAIQVLSELHRELPFQHLYCHQENGGQFALERNRNVVHWCHEVGVEYREWRQSGVIRPCESQDVWDREWRNLMQQPRPPSPEKLLLPNTLPKNRAVITAPAIGMSQACPDPQKGGSRRGEALLKSFLERRCVSYEYKADSPVTAPRSCSRLSPHLAYGTVSLRQVYQQVFEQSQHNGSLPRKQRSLASFRSRLNRRCGSLQMLEDEPELEWRARHRELATLKHAADHSERLDRWREGQTGWPLVDACMRALEATGWLNFRMRAMLTAVAGYQLWLPWRDPALHLARLFTDFEPGIHYPQVQIQSGLMDTNALRIYNPVLQSRKQDPEGRFIRRWVPELESVPTPLIHTPWQMSAEQKARYGAGAYPPPICDHEQAARAARERISKLVRGPAPRYGSDLVFEPSGTRRDAALTRPGPMPGGQGNSQQSLFDE